jgi:hypothetical protein
MQEQERNKTRQYTIKGSGVGEKQKKVIVRNIVKVGRCHATQCKKKKKSIRNEIMNAH